MHCRPEPPCVLTDIPKREYIIYKCFFIEFAKLCIPNKTIVVREDDKPWYDSEIRWKSRKRDRLKKTALKTGNTNDWKKIQNIKK